MVADTVLLLLGVSSEADESVEIDEDDVDVETRDGVERSDSLVGDEFRLATSVAAGADGGDGESTGDGEVVSVDIAGAD